MINECSETISEQVSVVKYECLTNSKQISTVRDE